nr:ESPR domain-containing protein [Burkholderiales bacterium]
MNGHASINRVYRLVWNEQTNTWVAVSELTRARGKRSSSSNLVNLAALLATVGFGIFTSPAAYADLPGGATVKHGSVSFSAPNANQSVITQNTQKAIIDWNTFSIG